MSAALHWLKSSYSTEQGGNCIEIAIQSTAVRIRDSKAPEGPTLIVGPHTWADFTAFAREQQCPQH
ncbi:DUF397 domain-containing protein [Streptomyces sp. Ru73]|uniref:DUF397 domain-containing protein n=1 Tax=Streptomyces sp. Ru73 TaxID=2080748 RepID=UPI000CDDA887|nr:DUF397 domain-containing protein [Streptomyces sp. Ru73]POX37584.1 DUF397 domain-containing protein [Streptomyces sp. Ru73]